MDKLMSLGQLVMSVIMLHCVVAWGIGSTIKGDLSIPGIIVVLFIAYLVWTIVRTAWVEYQQEKNK